MSTTIDPMARAPLVAALRVTNEAFLVASTIERCPKTMMLRELVMNALEAAAGAPAGERRVEIGTAMIAGHPKLCIWNTGPGMTGEELHRITNLASSLHKANTLDANFGMGAKVAALPSNRHGLRFRSCRGGVVSEVMLGQRDGVYGRLLDEQGREVRDVTDIVARRARYDLAIDWTEVVLLGQRPEQDTATDPYDGNPVMPARWIETALTQRFYRLPDGILVTLAGEITGGAPRRLRPLADRTTDLARAQTVAAPGGLLVHYGYDPPEGAALRSARAGERAIGGTAGLVYRNEVFALREGAAWALEAPNFAIPFGARHCAVFVELPDDFGVRPEAYRQFLRFRDGDQRQVVLGDFAAVARAHMPGWLREIIATYGPAAADYAGELRTELAALVEQLGIVARSRAPAAPRGAAVAAAPPAAPRPRRLEVPPEIISLHDAALIDERGLAARAGKYHPDTHQIFVNLRYPAIDRMAAQLVQAFETVADPARTEALAREVAEWAITRKLARAVVHTLGKRAAGWTAEEVARAQSPESLSVVADDGALLLASARRRLAEALGVAEPAVPDAPLSAAARLRGELAEAEQQARRALADPAARVAPILRRVSDIEARRHNLPAALDWARRAVAADPADPWSHNQVSLILLQQGDLDGAEQAAQQALALAAAAPARFLRQLASVARQRGRLADAMALMRRAVAAEPGDPRCHSELGWLLQQSGDLAGAEAAVRRALALGADRKAAYLRQLSALARQRGEAAQALDLARQAVAADDGDPASHSHLATVLQAQGELAAAAEAARQALARETLRPARYLRQLSGIARQQRDLTAALALAEQAVAAEPDDAWSHSHFAGLLMETGDLDAAEAAARRALDLGGSHPAAFLRQLSQIEVQRKNLPAAIDLVRQCLAAAPNDPWVHKSLSSLLLLQGDADAAEAPARQALALAGGGAGFLLQLSTVERQRGHLVPATEWAERAVAADPTDPAGYLQLAALWLQRNEPDAAEALAHQGRARSGDPGGRLARLLSELALRRRNLALAITYGEAALAADPGNIWAYDYLAGLLTRAGDLARAQETAELALALPAGDPAPIRRRLDDIAARRRTIAA